MRRRQDFDSHGDTADQIQAAETAEAEARSARAGLWRKPPPEDNHSRFVHVWQLFGYAVLDSGGRRIGSVDRVWADNAAGTLKFIGIKSQWFPMAVHVIPAADAQIDEAAHSIRVAHDVERIHGAPTHNTDVGLTADEERKVFTHYDKR